MLCICGKNYSKQNEHDYKKLEGKSQCLLRLKNYYYYYYYSIFRERGISIKGNAANGGRGTHVPDMEIKLGG